MKIKNRLKIYLILFIAILGFNSCYNDALELYPEDQLSDGSYWKSANDFKLAANSYYFTLQGWRPTDENSDIMTPTTGINSVSNGSYIPSEENGFWNGSYKNIRDFNYLLMKADEYEGKEQAEVDVYVAEAKFFRAYAYFHLLKSFGGVPLILEPLDITSEELTAQRASRDDVVNQVLKDLDEAIPVLPNESSIPESEKGRISKQGAKAFKARVTLFEGTWQKFRQNQQRADNLLDQAISASNDVISSGEYELFKALGDSSYRYLFIIDNNAVAKSNPLGLTKTNIKEYCIARKYSYELNITYNNTHNLLQFSCPTRKMADMYLCEDGLPIDKSPLFQGRSEIISEYLNRDIRMMNSFRTPGKRHYAYGSFGRNFDDPDNPGPGVGIHKPNFGENTSTGYSVLKFMTEKRDISSGQEEADYPVLRYAEVLLIYAEAKFERDGSISDADLNKSINVVRDRVDLPPLTNSFVNSNGLNMREEIRRERTVELFLEGFRFDDLRRWKTAETKLPMPLLGIKYTGTEFETDPFYADLDVSNRIDSEGNYIWVRDDQRQFLDRHYLLPLPTNQVEMMGIEQNPGW